MNDRLKHMIAMLGPGLLMAGAAIGVSHLVQSTRAGAEFGFILIPLVLLVNILKYPFFEYGHRYIVATGKTLLEGYQELGKGYLWAFLAINLITALGSIAALFFVTSSIVANLMGDFFSMLGDYGLLYITITLILICSLIYNIGHYNFLDRIMKLLMLVLFIATITAFVIALFKTDSITTLNQNESPFDIKYLGFLLALMGWMPGPVEMSVWQSLWIKAKEQDTGEKYSAKMAKIDFNIGYFLCMILAVIFIALGAIVMHGSGESFSPSGVKFAGQLIDLYAQNIGTWAVPIISLCAFTTIFSTSLTLYDAYPRALAEGFSLVSQKLRNKYSLLKILFSIVTGLFTLLVMYYFIENKKGMTFLVDIVTITAFITAPFFAYLNTKLVFSKKLMPKDMQPSLFMKILSVAGIIFLLSFVAIYVLTF